MDNEKRVLLAIYVARQNPLSVRLNTVYNTLSENLGMSLNEVLAIARNLHAGRFLAETGKGGPYSYVRRQKEEDILRIRLIEEY